MPLISLEQARRQIRLTADDTSFDEELDPLREVATAIVVDYIKRPDHGWTEDYDPTGSPYDQDFVIVQHAIAEVLANLWANKGDADAPGPLTVRVMAMLERLRDPAIA